MIKEWLDINKLNIHRNILGAFLVWFLLSVLWGLFAIDKEILTERITFRIDLNTALPQMAILIQAGILYIIISLMRTRIFLAFISIYVVFVDALNLSAPLICIISGKYLYAIFLGTMWILLTIAIICFTICANHSILKHRSIKINNQKTSEYLKYNIILLKRFWIPGVIAAFLFSLMNSCLH